MRACFGFSQSDLASEYPHCTAELSCWCSLSEKLFSYCISFFPHPIYYPFTTLALPPSSITQIRGHIAGPPAPSALRYMPKILSRESSIFFPRRFASNCTYPRCSRRSQQLLVNHFSAFISANGKGKSLTTLGIELKDQRYEYSRVTTTRPPARPAHLYNLLEEMIYQQSAESTSSRKQHKIII